MIADCHSENGLTWTTGIGQRLVGVHPRMVCVGRACAVHNPSDHSMREFKTCWRADRGFMERICPHGVGHPDPDDYYADPIHGCDGCCGANPEEPTAERTVRSDA